jgi:hypothetical protein
MTEKCLLIKGIGPNEDPRLVVSIVVYFVIIVLAQRSQLREGACTLEDADYQTMVEDHTGVFQEPHYSLASIAKEGGERGGS